MAPQHADGARRVVEHLGLEPHPEGGWFRRTWSAPADHPGIDRGSDPGEDAVDDTAGERAAGSSILYLLEADLPSHWHRIDASELWQHAAGAPVRLSRWAGDGTPVRHDTLGPDLLDGESPQVVVDPQVWQSASTSGAWSLVVCVVVPEFRFDGFELAPAGWYPPV